jgi:hypothetical protein
MPIRDFQDRLSSFYEFNRQSRLLELDGKRDVDPALLSRRQEALESLLVLYQRITERSTLAKALADPYFPLTMQRRLNGVEFVREPQFGNLTDSRLTTIMGESLLERAEIFLSIREDLGQFNTDSQVLDMRLKGSPQEALPEGVRCNHCGGCCEIRGGSPQFTRPFRPPDHWLVYFQGDGLDHQRFCPFLFEYFATAKYFCAIYNVKPRGCWEFDREECEFLQKDVAMERATHAQADGH